MGGCVEGKGDEGRSCASVETAGHVFVFRDLELRQVPRVKMEGGMSVPAWIGMGEM